MEEIIKIVADYHIEIIMGLSLGLLISLIMILVTNRNNKKRIEELYKKIHDTSNAALEARLEDLSLEIEGLEVKSIDQARAIENLDKKTRLALQKVGFVRYNAFKDSGSELSYSIALLDENHDGFVLSSIYANGSSINYSKKVNREKSDVPLSVEEMIAMERALNIEEL